ncbi:MAG: hypothetical protein RR630_06900 [Coprobacillus sp.]
MQKEVGINNITDTMLLFDTKSKQNIIDLCKWKCKRIHDFNIDELVMYNQFMSLPICLDDWIDIDSEKSFENILIALLRITDPIGGRPGLSLSTVLVGYDCDTNMNFIFCGQYYHGKHSLLGYYENGQEMRYQEELVFTGVLDKQAYAHMKHDWE